MDWPDRGVYFFFASDERRNAGDQLRITRIGTHAVSEGSSTSLWNRLRTHRGAKQEPTKAAGIIEAPFSGNESARRSLSVIP